MSIDESVLKNLKKGLPKRLTIDGNTKEYDSYLIPLEYLYYNNLNGRIATYVEEYNDQSGNVDLDDFLKNDKEKYNDLISGFIKRSSNDNEESFKTTKQDIYKKGQQVPGVVLTDGRIIDGNRRFTAIRELYKETGDLRFGYFEAVCLEAPSTDDVNGWKRIKSLELFLQFNVDEKRGYNKIDSLVSFYKDTMDEKTKMFDKKQYVYASGISPAEYDKNERIIKIMLDYLEWRNRPKAFYILKNEKLDGPIEEIANITKKMNAEEWNSIKDYIYQYMTHVQVGDRTRDMRELVQSAKARGVLFQKFKETIDTPDTMMELAKAVEMKDKKVLTPEESQNTAIQKVKTTQKLISAFESAKYQAKIVNINNEPKQILDSVILQIKKIDAALLKTMSKEQKQEIIDRIAEADKMFDALKAAINNE